MNRKLFLISGIVLFLIFILMVCTELIVSSKVFNYNMLLFFSLSIFSFTQYYIFPHLKDNDERSKEIKFKSISYSSLILLILTGLMIMILTMSSLVIETMDLLKLIITIFIVIQSIFLIIVSKKI